jgi:uncharacterized protein (DUF849 family)
MRFMSGLMITVAPTGAETAKAECPQLPTSIAELVAEAKAAEASGASLVHVHVRDDQHQPTLDVARLKDTVAALKGQTSLIVQLSTGGSVHDPLAARLAVLDAEPESCSLTCGTVNFGGEIFVNPWPFMVDLFVKARDLQVVPEFELFDVGHVHAMARLLETQGLPYGGKVHCDLVLGVPGAMPGTAQALAAMVAALPVQVTSWSATGIGRSHLTVLAGALAFGGHIRVGMEDNLIYAKGRPVQSNAELVARAVRVAAELQRPILTPSEARTLLAIRPTPPNPS